MLAEPMQFHYAELENGLTVIAETNPAAQSVAAGYFVKTGARDETPDVSGVSHFLEHMAFKGDERYTAEDVNRIFDEIGARYNASTSEEITTYYANVLPEYLPKTVEMLSALIRPSLRGEDFDLEKNVILEEIGMYDDQPSFLAYDTAMATHFAGHPLGSSILGSVDSITALTSDQMRTYHADHYRAGNLIFAIAGNVDWDDVLRLANENAGSWPPGRLARPADEGRATGGTHLVTRESNVQQHVMALAAAPPAQSAMRFAAELLTVIVGDDSGSRLFWELVDPGDVEACELGYNEYDGAGTWLTYLSGSPEDTAANLDRVRAIYDAVNREGVTAGELETAKNKVLSRIVLRSERPMGRLSSLGGNWLYRQEYRSVADDLDAVRRLTVHDLRDLLAAYPLALTTTVGIGPLDKL
ncbi:MAG: pitrilysin family protein [Planctomycetaceae bacterium]